MVLPAGPTNPMMPTTLVNVTAPYRAVVFDQWGVLHNGSVPYAGAVEAIEHLAAQGKILAVLSNSGKRAAPNAQRIAAMGLPTERFAHVMTSGEAFWQDCQSGRVSPGRLLPIVAKPGDFELWNHGLNLHRSESVQDATSVLLMGLPEGTDGRAQMEILDEARACDLPLYCTNPDRGSPRADGLVQLSPGALARRFQESGGTVTYYGKPHPPIFEALSLAMGAAPQETLMVGDSLEHDIAGAAAVGWRTAFVMGGLHADAFHNAEPSETLRALAAAHGSPIPDFVISRLASPGA
jgi:HAD superfamily hydrolase (TIGR01459 family)